MTLEKVIEALLFSAQKPLSIQEITGAIKGAEGDPASSTPNEFARLAYARTRATLAAHFDTDAVNIVSTVLVSATVSSGKVILQVSVSRDRLQGVW